MLTHSYKTIPPKDHTLISATNMLTRKHFHTNVLVLVDADSKHTQMTLVLNPEPPKIKTKSNRAHTVTE